jgi:hypothetical protein
MIATDRGRENMIVPSKGERTLLEFPLYLMSYLSSVSLVLSLRQTDMDSECLGTRFDYKGVIIRYNDVTRSIIMVLFTTGRLHVYIKHPGSYCSRGHSTVSLCTSPVASLLPNLTPIKFTDKKILQRFWHFALWVWREHIKNPKGLRQPPFESSGVSSLTDKWIFNYRDQQVNAI